MPKKYSKFSVRLEGCMSRMGLNQVELAKKLGISQSVISGWLRDRNEPNLPMLLKLSQYFQVSLADLTGLESLKGIKQKVDDVKAGKVELSEQAIEFARLYNGITDESKKELIEAMILKAAEGKVKKNGENK